MRILILYDNVARSPLREGWGFSALIEVANRRVLFDAGADRLVLLHNCQVLGVNLSQLTDVFLSHSHCDHIGGLSFVLEKANAVRLWALSGMARYLRPRVRAAKAELILVNSPLDLGDGLASTGAIGRKMKEHGLIVSTQSGAVLITGCAHPGIDRMAERATQLSGAKLSLVLGGFHLGGISPQEISAIADRLAKLANSVAPGHCTGEKAIPFLLARFPSGFALEAGKEYQVKDFV